MVWIAGFFGLMAALFFRLGAAFVLVAVMAVALKAAIVLILFLALALLWRWYKGR